MKWSCNRYIKYQSAKNTHAMYHPFYSCSGIGTTYPQLLVEEVNHFADSRFQSQLRQNVKVLPCIVVSKKRLQVNRLRSPFYRFFELLWLNVKPEIGKNLLLQFISVIALSEIWLKILNIIAPTKVRHSDKYNDTSIVSFSTGLGL